MDNEAIDNAMADVMWWIKGYLARDDDHTSGLDSHHIEALRLARLLIQTKETK